MTGYMAISRAGHDKDKIYLIIREEKEYVYLVDGKSKDFDNPKKKNKKHIQVVRKFENPAVTEKLLRGERIDRSYIIQEVNACQKQMLLK